MRKLIFMVIVCAGLLCACTPTAGELDTLFLGDTVINIPLKSDPTVSATVQESAPQDITAPPTAPEETAATEPSSPKSTSGTSKSTSSSSSKSTTTKSSTSKSSTTKSTTTKSSATKETTATQPPQTDPAPTQPPMTEPPVTAPPETEATEPAAIFPAGSEYAIAEQINAQRANAGLDALTVDSTLCTAAALRAYESCLSWSHTRPSGSSWQSVLSEQGIGYNAASELLVHTAMFDAAAIVGKWMENSSADLLSPDVTAIGVGAYSSDGTLFLAAILVG